MDYEEDCTIGKARGSTSSKQATTENKDNHQVSWGHTHGKGKGSQVCFHRIKGVHISLLLGAHNEQILARGGGVEGAHINNKNASSFSSNVVKKGLNNPFHTRRNEGWGKD